MDGIAHFSLVFEGATSENHAIDFYDVAQALMGFQRSLALTTHLVLNDEIITQAPALKGAKILAIPSEEGSWQATAVIVGGITTGLYALTTAPKGTVLGHVVHSAYDYVISESLGFHVDYDKTLQQLKEEHDKSKDQLPEIRQHRLDSLVEKCSAAVREIHRPIYKSETALKATIRYETDSGTVPVGGEFTQSTFDYIREEISEAVPILISGRVSSYNSNTYKGRIYVADEGRPIPFELEDICRSISSTKLITASLSASAAREFSDPSSTVSCKTFKILSKSGQLKRYKIVEVEGSGTERDT